MAMPPASDAVRAGASAAEAVALTHTTGRETPHTHTIWNVQKARKARKAEAAARAPEPMYMSLLLSCVSFHP
jgi:hypothetical protein